MKKLIAILMMVFMVAMLASCNVNSGDLIPGTSSDGQEEVIKPEEDDKGADVVTPIIGGGDFNAGNNYN